MTSIYPSGVTCLSLKLATELNTIVAFSFRIFENKRYGNYISILCDYKALVRNLLIIHNMLKRKYRLAVNIENIMQPQPLSNIIINGLWYIGIICLSLQSSHQINIIMISQIYDYHWSHHKWCSPLCLSPVESNLNWQLRTRTVLFNGNSLHYCNALYF